MLCLDVGLQGNIIYEICFTMSTGMFAGMLQFLMFLHVRLCAIECTLCAIRINFIFLTLNIILTVLLDFITNVYQLEMFLQFI